MTPAPNPATRKMKKNVRVRFSIFFLKAVFINESKYIQRTGEGYAPIFALKEIRALNGTEQKVSWNPRDYFEL